MRLIQNVVTGSIILLLGCAIGLATDHYYLSKKPFKLTLPLIGKEIRNTQPGYKYTNELLDCEVAQDGDFQEITSFKTKIQSIIDARIKNGDATHVAVYYRGLNNGTWTSINADDAFYPASLLKVPLMMGVLKQSEMHPEMLQTKLEYSAADDSHASASATFKQGEKYTVEQLIEHMLTYSDNTAAKVLSDAYTNAIPQTIDDLSIHLVPVAGGESQITVRIYASFFRILFNASYLQRNLSEKALSMLSRSTYKSGLVAGVPSTVDVAHKFGERTWLDSTEHQLHDCGIIYYPNHPYLLCVMTRGQSVDQLTQVIADISKLVYDETDSQVIQAKGGCPINSSSTH